MFLTKPPAFPFGAISVPFATDTRELMVLLAGTELNSTPRQTIQFTQPVQIVGFYAEVVQYTYTTPPFVVPQRQDIMVQIDLDDRSSFTSQENNQIVPGKWVSLSSQLVTAAILKLIQPLNRTPVFGLSFRWKVPPTAGGGVQIFEDALISFDTFVNFPEGG
jgi:hypothetical protein